MAEILVLYYSRNGSVARLARQIARGVEEVDGASARLHLSEIASHGYLAIAPGKWRNGPNAKEPPAPPREPAADGTFPPAPTSAADLALLNAARGEGTLALALKPQTWEVETSRICGTRDWADSGYFSGEPEKWPRLLLNGGSIEIVPSVDTWIRESGGIYENDWISVWDGDTQPGNRRYGMLEFDLSTVDVPITDAQLQLYALSNAQSGHNWEAFEQIAFSVDPAGLQRLPGGLNFRLCSFLRSRVRTESVGRSEFGRGAGRIRRRATSKARGVPRARSDRAVVMDCVGHAAAEPARFHGGDGSGGVGSQSRPRGCER